MKLAHKVVAQALTPSIAAVMRMSEHPVVRATAHSAIVAGALSAAIRIAEVTIGLDELDRMYDVLRKDVEVDA